MFVVEHSGIYICITILFNECILFIGKKKSSRIAIKVMTKN